MYPFNKNAFKEEFRLWIEENNSATLEEAKAFCIHNIPSGFLHANPWILAQSIQWFQWLKSQKTFEEDFDSDEDELTPPQQNYSC